jgi:D-xylulose reductase
VQLNGDSNGDRHAQAHGPRHVPEGDHKFEWAKRRVASWIKQAGLARDGGVDNVVEATGAEDGMMYGIALGKQGSACEWGRGSRMGLRVKHRYFECSCSRADLAVGLSHQQTHRFPTLAVTYKEMDVRGITRYTSVCFPSALDMLSRGVVDVKSMITSSFPLSQSQQAFEAVAGGKELKVIIRNQEV